MPIATAANGWVNTNERQSSTYFQQALDSLQTNRFCTLATCSADGMPWASPLLYNYDQNLTVYWSSAIAALHSDNLLQNNRCSITVYDSAALPGTVNGLYLTGIADVIDDDRAEVALECLFARSKVRPDRVAADYLGVSPRRFYQFQPQGLWVTGERVQSGRQLVDNRVELDLATFIQYLTKASQSR